jgi:Kef-type K+ transport system membrane component KefB
MSEQPLLVLAIAIAAGLLMSRLGKPARLPNVTAYLVGGLLLGPVFGLITPEVSSVLSVLSDVALGFIAYSIGGEFKLSYLKKIGKAPLTITAFQGIMTAVCVDAGLIAFGVDVPLALLLGAIALATAPAATLMVVRQYKAKGPVTDVLLPVVALDDAVGLVVFAVSFGIAQSMKEGDTNLAALILEPLAEVVLSLALGGAVGMGLTYLERFFHSHRNRNALIVGSVILTVAISPLKLEVRPFTFGFSSLLVCMMLGTMFCNLSEYSTDIMKRSERWTAPLYTVFFVLSGAPLELDVFKSGAVILIGVVYILIRCAGKYLGAFGSCAVMKVSPTVRTHLGITLFPQAGVALGMVVSAQALGAAHGGMIRNIILFSVLIYELVGPLLTKQSLEKAGEIAPANSEAANRARFEKKETTK